MFARRPWKRLLLRLRRLETADNVQHSIQALPKLCLQALLGLIVDLRKIFFRLFIFLLYFSFAFFSLFLLLYHLLLYTVAVGT